MRLSLFIIQQKESILQQWENFARTIEPPALTMDAEALRDHASLILDTIAKDLDTQQTSLQQSQKLKGHGPRGSNETYAEIHASLRIDAGYTIDQLVSEYRALRASVLKLWMQDDDRNSLTDSDDVMRFNEVIDQALAESVARYSKIATEAVENERLRLDALLKAVPVGIAMADINGKLILANPENLRIWGDHPLFESLDEYAKWKGWWADGSEKHGQPVLPHEWALARALSGVESPRDIVEIEPFGQPGVRRTILLHATPILDAIKNVVGSVAAQVDITALRTAEAQVRESEAKFRTISDAMPQMVWSTLPNGYHDYYNQQWYDFTGVSIGAADHEEWIGLFHPDCRSRASELWLHSLATGTAYQIECQLKHFSGQYRWILARALPVCDDAGKIARWMGTCTDIHDQKLAEERLKENDRRKDEFLAMLAHELRNPLAPISAAAQLLQIVSTDEKRVKQTCEVIERQVDHMTSLVDDLLDVSRVTGGLIKIETKPQDIRNVVQEAIEQVTPLIQERRHHLTHQLTPDMAMLLGDSKRLVQILANILTNAAKYTLAGGNIRISSEVRSAHVLLEISDNGIGMESGLVARAFGLFEQAERTSDRSSGGLGLGLALVRSLVELHGGTVTCESKGAGKGSKFTVCLPRLIGSDNAGQVHQDKVQQISRSVRSLRILLVDDNVDAAKLLAMFLTELGHQVAVEHGSVGAVERAIMEKPDVCLLDIGLPEMDGNTLARQLRSVPVLADAMLIAVTGYGQPEDIKRSLEAGFDQHLVKPVNMKKLVSILDKVSCP
ncbi:ATP-binding protein [Oxalobacteraceae bacterium R-40]|uniref:histidine kinase n=1 Tax=Keguizhuia sedimenti TaxID=3064264 RepID=A0ABU1BMQ3_9BURK|nr:ATP-binding protein [Oxalobacteraceae bacterium R-40]